MLLLNKILVISIISQSVDKIKKDAEKSASLDSYSF